MKDSISLTALTVEEYYIISFNTRKNEFYAVVFTLYYT